MPAFLTETEVEARNAEHKIGSVITDMAAINFFSGSLAPQCNADNDCDGQCDGDCHWLVTPGDDIIIEVYDRATTSIWATLTAQDSLALAAMFRTAADLALNMVVDAALATIGNGKTRNVPKH